MGLSGSVFILAYRHLFPNNQYNFFFFCVHYMSRSVSLFSSLLCEKVPVDSNEQCFMDSSLTSFSSQRFFSLFMPIIETFSYCFHAFLIHPYLRKLEEIQKYKSSALTRVYIHICAHSNFYTCVQVCTCSFECICTFVHVHVNAFSCEFQYVCVCVNICMYASVSVYL